ncbi:transglycosylase SLT domain-containing protein [Kineobactrum salinum]|uniref:Transglycosylase SLT domain-containing protein n=1 Tax=Kineobactrum salinum TaxID=2708301 RepID=A0A6C0TX44_9GAMM|nr:transglycosylase SLT domain-containing protein [Kineobactrum salinum]QIB64400.1 hypothetical protein G3T16_02260 [Kineobactrum salinum]
MRVLWLPLLLLLSACTTAPPANPDNVCSIFREKKGWYGDAYKARANWHSPIPVMMAIMHQESRFVAKAKPPRRRILGIIPGPRLSDSFGYSQALGSTWKAYQRSTGRGGADRDDFADAIDFIGWYNNESLKHSGIARDDSYRLYLAYHEGHGGYNRGTYRNKPWLQKVAQKVSARAGLYRSQLAACESSLPRRKGWFGLF